MSSYCLASKTHEGREQPVLYKRKSYGCLIAINNKNGLERTQAKNIKQLPFSPRPARAQALWRKPPTSGVRMAVLKLPKLHSDRQLISDGIHRLRQNKVPLDATAALPSILSLVMPLQSPHLPLYKGASQLSQPQIILSHLKHIGAGGAGKRFLLLLLTAGLSTLVVSTLLFRVSTLAGRTMLVL